MRNVIEKIGVHFVLANRRGSTLVYMLVALPCLILFGSLAVDYGRMQVAKTEVRTAAVAAARAGGQTFMNGGDMTTIVADAISTARMNMIDGNAVTIRSGDIKLGVYFPTTKLFVETGNTQIANALRINLTHQFGRDSSSLSFLPVFDATNRCVTAQATIMIESDGFNPDNYTYLITTPGASGGSPGTPGSTTTTITDPGTVITEADASKIVSTWTPTTPDPICVPTPAPVKPSPFTIYIPPTPDTSWSTPSKTTVITTPAPQAAPAKKMTMVE